MKTAMKEPKKNRIKIIFRLISRKYHIYGHPEKTKYTTVGQKLKTPRSTNEKQLPTRR